jgi:fatty-acyl-CoA synthase
MDIAALVDELKRSSDTFGPFIRQQAEAIPDRTLLKFERETITYGTYNAEVNRLAGVLQREGIGAADVVAILCLNSPLFLIALGACAKLGAVAALINTHVTGAGLSHVLRVSEARLGVADEHALEALDAVVGTHGVRFLAAAAATATLPPAVRPLGAALETASAAEPRIPDVRGGDVFLYIYTSGTTGYPKPAIVRHLRFTMGGIGLSQMLGIESGETIYAPLPLYHGESLFVGFAPAVRIGGAFASRRRFSATAFLDDVRRHDAVAFVYVGELCRYLLRQPPTPGDRDHRLRIAAGAGLRADVWRAFQERFGIARIVEMYGATEGNVALQNFDGRVGSVGKPHALLEDTVRLARFDLGRGELARDADGRCIPCASGEAGELLGRVGGRAGSMEYDGYTDPAASERKLVRDAFEVGDAWFRTGDLLRQDDEGYYYFVDRIGDTFRWKGENVATQEVADVLNGAPGVSETNVYGVEVAGEDGRAGMAAVVLAPGHAFDADAFYARAERHLPAYARPAFVRVVPEMDVTGTLKQRKLGLAAEGWDSRTIADPLFVRDDAARTYVALTPGVRADLEAGRRRL